MIADFVVASPLITLTKTRLYSTAPTLADENVHFKAMVTLRVSAVARQAVR